MTKRKVFWLEEDKEVFREIIDELKKEYDIEIGAEKELVEKVRNLSFDLLIIDLMIHTKTDDNENINFKDVNWKETGIEFIRRVRKGDYEKCGFEKDIPIIVVTARSSYIKKINGSFNVSISVEKPISLDELEIAIEKTINKNL